MNARITQSCRAGLVASLLALAACGDGPAEEAGEEVDEAAEEAQESAEEATGD